MRKLHTALLLLGSLCLAGLIWKIGISRLWQELNALGWGLAVFIALEFTAEGIHTLGWMRCLSGPHRRLPWVRQFQIRMAGNAISYVTPTAALGGEVTKAALLSAVRKGPEAISGVLLSRLCSGAGHVLFVMAGSVFVLWRATLPTPVWTAMFASGALIVAGILAFLLLQKYGKLGGFLRWLAARKLGGRPLQSAAREIGKVDEVLKSFYRERPGDLAFAVGWHWLGHCTGLIQTWSFFTLLHQPVSLQTVSAIWVLGMWFDMLTFAVPLNLGTLEGSRVVAFKAIGYSAVLGMTYGLALRLAQLSCVSFGLLNYALLFPSWRPSRKYYPADITKS